MRSKLFVGNLNYETSVDSLESVFRPFQGYLHTKICYERHTGKPLGYAVVHFDNPAAAQYAIDMLHNVKVDGRHIVVAPYRPRVSDASASNASPRPASRPAANEAVALVMDLNKNATWMDLKDILSQRSKVLFVDEPRMVRTAFVHFASEEDMEQARAAFRNTQVLGSMVDLVPIGMDSVLMGSEHARMDQVPFQGRRQGQLDVGARGQHMHPPPSPQAMMPITYMNPAMPPMGPPYMGMDAQPYQMQRPPMWPGAHMQAFAPQFAVPAMQMQGQGAPAQAGGSLPAMGGPSSVPPSPPGMAGVGGGGGPLPPGHVAGSDLEGSGMQQYPIGVSGGYPAGQSVGMSPSGVSTGGAQQGAGPNPSGEGLTGSDGGSSYSPDLQQLVRQLAMQQLGGHSNLSTPEDR